MRVVKDKRLDKKRFGVVKCGSDSPAREEVPTEVWGPKQADYRGENGQLRRNGKIEDHARDRINQVKNKGKVNFAQKAKKVPAAAFRKKISDLSTGGSTSSRERKMCSFTHTNERSIAAGDEHGEKEGAFLAKKIFIWIGTFGDPYLALKRKQGTDQGEKSLREEKYIEQNQGEKSSPSKKGGKLAISSCRIDGETKFGR